jgi:hypothetical protein
MAKVKADWHQANPENKAKQAAMRATRKKTTLEYVSSYKERHGCFDCGNHFPARVLDFDHVNDDKEGGIATMVTNGDNLEKIVAEISKCQVVCANCHRIRTHKRGLGARRNP